MCVPRSLYYNGFVYEVCALLTLDAMKSVWQIIVGQRCMQMIVCSGAYSVTADSLRPSLRPTVWSLLSRATDCGSR